MNTTITVLALLKLDANPYAYVNLVNNKYHEIDRSKASNLDAIAHFNCCIYIFLGAKAKH